MGPPDSPGRSSARAEAAVLLEAATPLDGRGASRSCDCRSCISVAGESLARRSLLLHGMARKARDQQRRDARRIARRGAGKLDATRAKPARSGRPRDTEAATPPDQIHARLHAERQNAIDELARLGLSPERDESAGTGESPFEEGDVAQASERTDMSFMHRGRVAERINRLTRALER